MKPLTREDFVQLWETGISLRQPSMDFFLEQMEAAKADRSLESHGGSHEEEPDLRSWVYYYEFAKDVQYANVYLAKTYLDSVGVKHRLYWWIDKRQSYLDRVAVECRWILLTDTPFDSLRAIVATEGVAAGANAASNAARQAEAPAAAATAAPAADDIPAISADTETEASREALTAFIELCLEKKFTNGPLVSTPGGLSFRVEVNPIVCGCGDVSHSSTTFNLRLLLEDPKYGGGLARATTFPQGADSYDSGIVAGLNHKYLELYCSQCSRRDCPIDDTCIGDEDDGDEAQKRTLVASSGLPVKFVRSDSQSLLENVRKILKHAFAMKLCSCKQWFAVEGNAHCASCLAATAAGVADSCTVCHEPAAKRTRCCKQAMHAACHARHIEHAPPGREANCPTCRAGSYRLE
jgi:hypothetical protein